MEKQRKKTERKSKMLDAVPLPWDMAAQSKRMLTDMQVVQLYLPGATRGALSMGRFGKGPYSALPFKKINRACRYVECVVVRFVEEMAGFSLEKLDTTTISINTAQPRRTTRFLQMDNAKDNCCIKATELYLPEIFSPKDIKKASNSIEEIKVRVKEVSR